MATNYNNPDWNQMQPHRPNTQFSPQYDGNESNHIDPFSITQFNHHQPSPSSTTYTDMADVNGTTFPQPETGPMGYDASGGGFDLGTSSYLPTSHQQMYPQHNLSDVLPDLNSDLVNEILRGGGGGGDINSSIEKLSLEAGHTYSDQFKSGLAGGPMLAPYGITNGNSGHSSSSDSNNGSMTNGVLTNGAMGVGNMVEAPHQIDILEEPMEFGYRFRYEVEGKAHGGLQGQSSKNNGSKRGNKVYPELQVCDVPPHINEVTIEARLVSATEDYFPHPNKCSGKDCNESGIFRKTLKRNEHPEFRLMMSNLTILQIKKGDQKTSLYKQLCDMNAQQKKMNRQDRMVVDLDVKADELSKGKHNGVVRIRFQASYFDSRFQAWQVSTKHSISVHDQKQTNAAELRICRVSKASAPVSGGTDEIYLLCEKVTKEDIKVKFRHDKWEADGVFQGTDVHYQFAIVFRAPRYKNLDIQKPVEVDLLLFRPSTGTYSRPVPFKYYPTVSDEDDVRRKRKRPDGPGPSNMRGYPQYPPTFDGAYGGGGSSGGGAHYFNSGGGAGSFSDYPSGYSRSTASPTEAALNLSKKNNVPSVIEDVEGDSAALVEPVKSEVPSGDENEMDVEPEVVKREPVSPAKKEPVSPAKPSATSDADEDDLETDCAPARPKAAFVTPVREISKSYVEIVLPETETEIVSKSMRNPTSEKKDEFGTKTGKNMEMEKERNTKRYLEGHVALCEDFVIESLMNYAITGDHLYFISQFRYFLGVKDEYGDNSLHMAIFNGQHRALQEMLGICSATKTTSAVNQLNDKHQTPLHMAAMIRDVEMVELLLRHGADPTVPDHNGSNSFHMAASNKDSKTMQLLCQWFRSGSRDKVHLDTVNYEGYTPLHHAVQNDSIECVRELIQCGASVNKGDRTSGRTALHHTVQRENIVTTAELLLHAKADVNAEAYDGNTPLHLAICLGNEDITRLLLKSGANPGLRNRELCYDYDNDEEWIGVDAFGLCDEQPQMLEVVQNALVRDVPTSDDSDSIKHLSESVISRLSLFLDKESQDWKRLAYFFELKALINYMEETVRPTSTLLNYLASNGRSVKDLKAGLAKIARQDCIDVIERGALVHPFPTRRTEKTSREQSIKDSGFLDCPSGNLKSENTDLK